MEITKQLHYTFIIGVALLLGGCERVPYTQAVAVGGYLHTPWGKFEFRNISKKEASLPHLSSADSKYRAYLMADAGDVLVIYGVANISYNLIILEKKSKPGEKFSISLNGDTTRHSDQSTTLKAVRRNINQEWGNAGFENEDSEIFGGIKIQAAELSDFDKPYSVYIPFTLRDREFLVDLEAKKIQKHETKVIIGIPGSP